MCAHARTWCCQRFRSPPFPLASPPAQRVAQQEAARPRQQQGGGRDAARQAGLRMLFCDKAHAGAEGIQRLRLCGLVVRLARVHKLLHPRLHRLALPARCRQAGAHCRRGLGESQGAGVRGRRARLLMRGRPHSPNPSSGQRHGNDIGRALRGQPCTLSSRVDYTHGRQATSPNQIVRHAPGQRRRRGTPLPSRPRSSAARWHCAPPLPPCSPTPCLQTRQEQRRSWAAAPSPLPLPPPLNQAGQLSLARGVGVRTGARVSAHLLMSGCSGSPGRPSSLRPRCLPSWLKLVRPRTQPTAALTRSWQRS